MGKITVLVGTQWGDEGKGKWCDKLAEDSDMVVRYQGGNNAGHTLYYGDQKVVFHHIPSGFFHGPKNLVLSCGVVINPPELVQEIDLIKQFSVSCNLALTPERFKISYRAHVITPWHLYLDKLHETTATTAIGTTKKGIGPTYASKSSRDGLRMYELSCDDFEA